MRITGLSINTVRQYQVSFNQTEHVNKGNTPSIEVTMTTRKSRAYTIEFKQDPFEEAAQIPFH